LREFARYRGGLAINRAAAYATVGGVMGLQCSPARLFEWRAPDLPQINETADFLKKLLDKQLATRNFARWDGCSHD
jgi:hypothetical protein